MCAENQTKSQVQSSRLNHRAFLNNWALSQFVAWHFKSVKPFPVCTWSSRWYFRTLCIGTTSRSLRVNFPLLALLEHSWNKYNTHIYNSKLRCVFTRILTTRCHPLLLLRFFSQGRVDQDKNQCVCLSLNASVLVFKAQTYHKPNCHVNLTPSWQLTKELYRTCSLNL